MKSVLYSTYVDDFEALIKHTITQAVTQSVREEVQKIINAPHVQQEELLTIEEAIKFLHISKPTLYKWLKDGLIPCYRIKRRVYFKKQELFASMKSLTIKKRIP